MVEYTTRHDGRRIGERDHCTIETSCQGRERPHQYQIKDANGGSPGTLAITAKCVNNEPEIQLELSSPVSGGQQAAPLIYRSMSDAVNFAEAFVKARGPEGSNSAMFTSIAEDGSVSPP